MPSAADRSITPIEQSYTAKKRTAQSRFRIGSLASYTGQKKDLRGTVKVVSYEKQGGIVIEVDGVTATVSPFALVALGTASPRAEPTSRRSTRSSVPKATATPARIFRNGVVVGSNPPAPAPLADLVLVPIAPAVLLLAAPRIPLTTAASRIGRFGLWLLAWRGTVPRPERRALVRTMDVLPALDALAPEPAPVKQAVYPTLLYTIAVRDAAAPYAAAEQAALLDAVARTIGLPRAVVASDIRTMAILVTWPKWRWAVFTKKHGTAAVAP
jgi:hypothetical protein